MPAFTNDASIAIALVVAAATAALSTVRHPTPVARLAWADVMDERPDMLARAAPPGCIPGLDPVWLQEPLRIPADPAPPCLTAAR